ncbi:glycoside hydrolase family 18 protein, partial [Conidiobolus coronatus NRRL 28638]
MKIKIISFLFHLNSLSLPKSDSSSKHVVGYYVPWGRVEPEQVDWKKLTHVNYGFGVLYKKDDPASIFVDRYYDGNRIRKVQKLAKENGVKSLISLGGWTGGQTFSIVAKDPELRKKFINNALLFVRKNTKPDYDENPDGYDLDGIDIDWEYPARQAAKCNSVDPNDTANYLVLLKELREAMDKEFPNDHKILTAAVRAQPFDGPDGKPVNSVSEFAKYFDFINIMIYDIMGGWSATTGPNAPFDYDTSKGGDPYSFRQSIDDWLNAGFPADKLVPGLAFYGRSTTASTDMNANPGNQYSPKESTVPKGDSSDSNEPNFFCNEGTFY